MIDTLTSDDIAPLARQFPKVPIRILRATLATFLEQTGDRSAAVEAASLRIADAIAA